MLYLTFLKYIKVFPDRTREIKCRGLELATSMVDESAVYDEYSVVKKTIFTNDLSLADNTIKIYFGSRDIYGQWDAANTIGTQYSLKTILSNISKIDIDDIGHLRALSTDQASFSNGGRIIELDLTYPMSFLRANTVVNFGRL